MSSTPQRPGHRALRVGRRSESGRVYLVTVTTWRRRRSFADFDAARAACRAFTSPNATGDSNLLAWVLMPDHAHWLVQLGSESLGRVVARMKASVSRAIPGEQDHCCPVWSRTFHDRAVRRDQDLRSAARYVVSNPLRAALCRSLGDYPFWDAVWLNGTREQELEERVCLAGWHDKRDRAQARSYIEKTA